MTDEGTPKGFAEYFSRSFQLDLRSLAVFRIGLGVLVVLDLLNRGLWLSAHYTDWGVVPRHALLDKLWDRAWLSVHLFSGTPVPMAILFVITGAIAIALIIGYRTTLMTVLSWFLMISLHARNPMVLQGGDIVFRLLLFWAMFLPLGARWSIDAALDDAAEGRPREADGAYERCSRLVFSLLVAMGIGLLAVPAQNLNPAQYLPGLYEEGALFGWVTISQILVAAALVYGVASAAWIYLLESERERELELVDHGANAYHAAGAVAFVAQMSFIYVFAAILKTGDEWWPNLTATYFALSLDQFTTPLGDWLHTLGPSTPVLKVLTAGSLGLEAFGWMMLFTVLLIPVLLLDPIHRVVVGAFVLPMSFYADASPWVVGALAVYFFVPVIAMRWARGIFDFAYRSAPFFRMFAVVSFIGMHVGFAVTMRLGLFSYIVSVGWLALLPSWFWERIAERVESFGESCTIFVRSGGGLAEKGARLARGLLILPAARLEIGGGSDDEEDRPRLRAEVDGDTHEGFAALGALARRSAVGWPLWRVADAFGILKAAFRRTVGMLDEYPSLGATIDRMLPLRSYRAKQTVLGSILVVTALCGAFWWNMQTLNSRFSMTQPWRTLAVYVRLDQQWNMFAPYPLKEDGWYVIPGELRNGEKVSVFQEPHREPPEWDKPDDVSETYANQRWRKYMMNIWLAKYSEQRLYYGRYLCRKWNANHERDEQLMTFKIYFMKEMSTEPGEPDAEPEKTHLWSHHCFADPDDDDEGKEDEETSESSDTEDDSDTDAPDAAEIGKNLPTPTELKGEDEGDSK